MELVVAEVADSTFEVIATLPLLWEADFEEWVSHFTAALTEANATTRHGGHAGGARVWQLHLRLPAPPHTQYNMLVIPDDDGTIALLCDEAQNVPQDIVSEWRAAIDSATAATGKKRQPHSWTAILGPPVARTSDRRFILGRQASFGPFHFESTNKPLRDLSPGSIPQAPSLGGGTLSVSVPILVRASHSSYSWDVAARTGARELHQACGILSVAWGACVTVRESPRPLEWGVAHVPDRLFWVPEELNSANVSESSEPLEIPDWADTAWKAVQNKPWLSHAVAAFHEGMRASHVHPSLALIAFVASIEAVSQRVFHESLCSCGTHEDVAAKYRETLKLVLPENEAIELGESYKPRSHTVHQGRLHGYEPTVGHFEMNLWGNSQGAAFQWTTLRRTESASRMLLTRALKGELPTKRHFNA
jgi:hypothetical protein